MMYTFQFVLCLMRTIKEERDKKYLLIHVRLDTGSKKGTTSASLHVSDKMYLLTIFWGEYINRL